ncbi:uncharacterized protein [Notamacropus eugenii]|uniref:uncharacterized protein isoform X2 n=1 Tax=Notamacropus eugenii TaxID=9315 RepID=UPI003B67DF0E
MQRRPWTQRGKEEEERRAQNVAGDGHRTGPRLRGTKERRRPGRPLRPGASPSPGAPRSEPPPQAGRPRGPGRGTGGLSRVSGRKGMCAGPGTDRGARGGRAAHGGEGPGPEAPQPTGPKRPEPVGGGRGANKKGKKQPPPAHRGPGQGGGAEERAQDEQLRLQRELDWCVEQLELGLRTQRSTPKQAEQAARAVKTLRSPRAELPKKRQLMRALFGDYRARMEEDRKAALKAMEAARSAQVLPVEEAVRRKSGRICRRRPGGETTALASPEEEFKFNFF